MILNMVGGGGAGLNYSVKSYASESALPSVEKENTIAVITDVEITSWIFSATEPEYPTEGMVGFLVGAHSSVAFSATKKNPIMVYPLSAMQYINGAWVEKVAKSYQGGAWVDWIVHLYENGNKYTNVTGGWVATAADGANGTAPTISDNGSSMTISIVGHWRGGYAHTKNKVDVTGKSKLVCSFESAILPPDYSSFKFGLINTFAHMDTVDMPAFLAVTSKTGTATVTVDISAVTGEYYIGFILCSGDGSGSTAKINNITSITLE